MLKVHIIFIDLQKVYDTVPSGKLWESLQSVGGNNYLIKAIKGLYNSAGASIRTMY